MWWLVAVAWARPSNEVLDDLDRWHAGADQLVDGPRGCWIFEGEARQTFVLHQAADRFSLPDDSVLEASGPFVGRIEDGTWTRIDFRRTTHHAKSELEVDLTPLVGRLAEAGASSVAISVDAGGGQVAGGLNRSMNLLREAIEAWTGSVETRMARWDEEASAVSYLREVAVREGANDTVRITSTFPDAGPLATRVDAVWPKTMKVGQWPARVTLRDPQMHLLGFVHEGAVLPNAESVSLVVGVFGFTVGYEQHIRYLTATPCP